MLYQRTIEDAIAAANAAQYAPDEAWDVEYDTILTKKHNDMFGKCFMGEISLEEMHQLRVFYRKFAKRLAQSNRRGIWCEAIIY